VTPSKSPTPSQSPTNEPIDAVYVWNGGDELRFSLRSLDKYARWIRKVHVVTDGRTPDWIHREHPRLSLVKYEDLLRGRNAPSGLNTDAVAWQLFRIPGISRQFLHLDTNCCLGGLLTPADFLTPKAGNRFFVESSDIPAGSTAEKLLNSRFGDRSPRKKPARTPRFFDKNYLEEVNRLWEKPIQQGGVSLETLYFYYLVECPQQYGIHEKANVTPQILREAPLSDAKQLGSILFGRPRFLCLTGGESGIATRAVLKLMYWRRSSLEK
jgi:hypothetical protein